MMMENLDLYVVIAYMAGILAAGFWARRKATNQEEFLVAASHDAGQTFSVSNVNPNAQPGWSLAGGATIDPSGNVYFGWTAYSPDTDGTRPVDIYDKH